ARWTVTGEPGAPGRTSIEPVPVSTTTRLTGCRYTAVSTRVCRNARPSSVRTTPTASTTTKTRRITRHGERDRCREGDSVGAGGRGGGTAPPGTGAPGGRPPGRRPLEGGGVGGTDGGTGVLMTTSFVGEPRKKPCRTRDHGDKGERAAPSGRSTGDRVALDRAGPAPGAAAAP